MGRLLHPETAGLRLVAHPPHVVADRVGRDIVHRLDLRKRAKGAGPDDARRKFAKGRHAQGEAHDGRACRPRQGCFKVVKLVPADRDGLLKEERKVACEDLNRNRRMQVAPGANHDAVEVRGIQHGRDVWVRRGAVEEIGELRPEGIDRRIDNRHDLEVGIMSCSDFHHMLQSTAKADHTDARHPRFLHSLSVAKRLRKRLYSPTDRPTPTVRRRPSYRLNYFSNPTSFTPQPDAAETHLGAENRPSARRCYRGE